MAEQTSSNSIGTPFIELLTVDSTNKYAMGLVQRTRLTDGQELPQNGLAIFSHHQTDGKGQRGKTWTSEPGANIALSVLLKPDFIALHEQFYLSAAVALAVHQFFSGYAGDETKIKWPNDLYWRDRKAGGILIESSVSSQPMAESAIAGQWQWAVAGIGININQTSFPLELPNPVSLKQITGKNFEPLVLAKELCNCLEEQISFLKSGRKEELIGAYNRYLYKLNEKVNLKKEGRKFEAVVKGVSAQGKLITAHPAEEVFDFGTVEWVV